MVLKHDQTRGFEPAPLCAGILFRAWNNPETNLFWLYRRNPTGRIEFNKRSAKCEGFVRELYSWRPDGMDFRSATPDQLERDFFIPLDNAASLAHQKLVMSGLGAPTVEDRSVWALFLKSLLDRSPGRIREVEQSPNLIETWESDLTASPRRTGFQGSKVAQNCLRLPVGNQAICCLAIKVPDRMVLEPEQGFVGIAAQIGCGLQHGCGTGDVIVLNGVDFDFNKATLTPNAKTILDQVSEELVSHPDIKVELAGHTDGRGSAPYNQKLSQKRADSVRKYFIDHGVTGDRMTAVGYGKSQPIDTNDTDDGRARNRRVELRITAGGSKGGVSVEALG